MGERKFTKGLGRPGMAAQLRETVSQVVRDSSNNQKCFQVDPLDFEDYIAKNHTVFQNDPQRELLLYPSDDVSQVVLPRRYRTMDPSIPSNADTTNCSLLTKRCIESYLANWNVIHYKYSAYSGSYIQFPSEVFKNDDFKEEIYEIDTDLDGLDKEWKTIKNDSALFKQGYLYKGPDGGGGASERMFANLAGSKSFKRRFCILKQQVDGTYILEVYKDDKKGDTKATIVMDLCDKVIRNSKKGRFCFELRMADTDKSYCLATDTEPELMDWMIKLQLALQHNSDKREDKITENNKEITPSDKNISSIPSNDSFGTLKGLEHSVNPQLMRYARETDSLNAHARQENRRRLFAVYPFLQQPSSYIRQDVLNQPADSISEPYKEKFGQRVLIECQALSFRLQINNEENDGSNQVEPYFTTMALFDIRAGKKISEDFHFDINHDSMKNLLNHDNQIDGHKFIEISKNCKVTKNWLFKQKQAIMCISKPHSDIFLVLRIDKVLQGGIVRVSEPYIKATTNNKDNGLKVFKAVKNICHRLSNYRMPFAWSARPLFRLYSCELDISSDYMTLYRQELSKLGDDDMVKILMEYRKPEKMNKCVIIPGHVQIKIQQLTSTPENVLTTCWTAVKPFPIPPSRDHPIIEITELYPDAHPQTTYINHIYVYPLSLAFDTQKHIPRARNITCMVQLFDSDNIDSKPIKCIYGTHGQLLSSMCTNVLYHSTNPIWYDEIKIRLPVHITPKHHLLFTFKHISVDGSRKKQSNISVETIVGYSWLPLIFKSKINVDAKFLPVSVGLPAGYLSVQPFGLGKGYCGPEVCWIDGQKPLFSFKCHLLSSIYSSDNHMQNLFAHAERLEHSKITTIIPPETETCKILKASHAIDLISVINFLPTLFNQLFNLLAFTSCTNIASNIIRLLVHIVDSIQESGRCDTLNIYIKYVFTTPATNTPNNTVHDQLLAHLPSLLNPDNTDFLLINKFLINSNFFFQIVIKSMGQYLLTSNRIKMRRNERFSSEYQSRVHHMLIDVLLPYVTLKHKEMPSQVAKLNMAAAHFLKKCLTFMDRGFVFRLINLYINSLSTCDSTFVRSAKLLFMKIVISHEHYVSFNLPVQNGQTPQGWSPHSQYYMSDEYCRHHFLTAILLREVSNSFCLPYEYRHSAIACFRDLLAKHELDDRYQSKGQMARIASLYLPWLGVVIENIGRLDYRKRIINQVKRPVHLSSPRPKNLTNDIGPRMSLNLRDSTYFAAIASHLTPSKKLINLDHQQQDKLIKTDSNLSINSCASNLSSPDRTNSLSMFSQETAVRRNSYVSESDVPNRNRHSRSVSGTQTFHITTDTSVNVVSKLEPAEVKDVLVCFLFVLKYSSQDQLISWWRYCTEQEIVAFFKIIELSLQEFRYMGRRYIMEETLAANNRDNAQPTSTTTTKKSMTLPARMQPPSEFNVDSTANLNCQTQISQLTPPILSSNGTGSIGRVENSKKDNSTSDDNMAFRVQSEANLTAEVGLVVLDALSSYCVHFKDTLMAYNGENDIMESVFSTLIAFLCIPQSTLVCGHVFATLRSFINNFSCVLFKGTAHLVGKLCSQLLNGCNSRSSKVRQESCAALYLLMRSNFELSSSNITRVHLQTVIAVSQLLGDLTSAGLNNSRFQESLSLINSYANSDKVMKNTGFPMQVKDLTRRVRTVLMATARMKDLNHDPEMLADLQHSLANSYASTPELRLTWLQTMARNHDDNGDFSEAACCRLHIAALVAQYRKLKGTQGWGAEAFGKISSNIARDETGLQLDSGGGSVAANDTLYGEQALLERLEACAISLRRAELYECFGELYKLVIPVYEHRKDYHALADCYRTVGNAYDTAVSARQSGRRMLGRYYRVTLFGQAYFGDQHGVEFVYKEPKLTPLSDISERLLCQYGDKFGRDNVRIIMDSSTISISDLDAKFAYIQITHVVPYHGEKYMEIDNDSVSEFERNHDIDSFVFETPFTLGGGQSQSGPRDQWKRQTIIKTEYKFPYVKKRLRVCARREIEQCPIQVAIDEMCQRVRELRQTVSAQPTDVKKLQLRLQGSVCVQVNAGPLAYARAFLEPQAVLELQADKVQDLKDTFREFISACFDALKLNRMLVSSDQIEYQDVMQENFLKMCRELSECIESDSLWRDVLQSCTSPGNDSRTLFTAISGASQDSSNA
ncbi:dedicator of cytokinesis protein 9 isoform X1 [Rhopalosiphum maidis]|uniref:dedicator of cytokinesis protein 9 isoform X1 n=1 Tax=Rhopalosiphum maidis TaxID=43146 RepID=UPI000F00F8E5|nr:dedicator of cytokinesis protein 9 isoform X1 [Rhopalosiphum maidis]